MSSFAPPVGVSHPTNAATVNPSALGPPFSVGPVLASVSCGTNQRGMDSRTTKITVSGSSGNEEMDEYFDDGSYQVTRCQSGALNVAQTVVVVGRLASGVPVYAADATTTVSRGQYYTTGASYYVSKTESKLRAEARSLRGTLVRRRSHARVVYRAPVRRAVAHAAWGEDVAKCNDGNYIVEGGVASYPNIGGWPGRTYHYQVVGYFYGGPAGDVYYGNLDWANVVNNCTAPGYLSTPLETPVFDGYNGEATPNRSDGVNSAMGGNANNYCNGGGYVLACTIVTANGTFITDADTVYDGQGFRFPNGAVLNWSFSGTPSASQTDMLSVTTHEVGHVVGLADVGDQFHQAESATIPTGDINHRYLGVGDYYGTLAIYYY